MFECVGGRNEINIRLCENMKRKNCGNDLIDERNGIMIGREGGGGWGCGKNRV